MDGSSGRFALPIGSQGRARRPCRAGVAFGRYGFPAGKTDRNRGVTGVFQRRGFTLIEVLIALVILSVGIVMVLRSFDNSLMALTVSRDTLRAGQLIEEKIVEIQTSDLGADGPSSGQAPFADSDYQWERRVRVVPDLVVPPKEGAAGERLKEVVTTVWRTGTDRRYSVATYVRQP